MTRIYIPSRGADDWRTLLADPTKHWRVGFSAMTLARCWETANGLPREISAMFAGFDISPELLVGLPEHKVPLPGAKRGESQSDLFALIRAGDNTFAVTIEGKVDESFDKLLDEWLVGASSGKLVRLAFIADVLGLKQPLPGDVYYQFLHRAAAAVIEARRFKTDAAAMIVHSFSPTAKWYDAFERFVALFGLRAERGLLLPVKSTGRPPLHVGWAVGDPRFLTAAS